MTTSTTTTSYPVQVSGILEIMLSMLCIHCTNTILAAGTATELYAIEATGQGPNKPLFADWVKTIGMSTQLSEKVYGAGT